MSNANAVVRGYYSDWFAEQYLQLKRKIVRENPYSFRRDLVQKGERNK